jgi:Actin like proteins N terminal domain
MTTEGAIVFGLDAGNSEATGVIGLGGNSRILTIPAEIGAGQLRDLQRIRGGAGAQGHLALGEYVLEIDGASCFVGRLALEQSAEASSARGDVARYWGGHTLRLLMVLAGALIKQPSFTLRVVSGLPITVWDMASTVPRVQQSLCGTHTFQLNGRARVMSVEAVLVVMEGAGALALHGVGDDVPQAVIDTGGRTTNLFWAQGQRPLLPRCAGFSRGVGDVGDVLAAWFLDHYGRELSPVERRDILWSAAQRKPHRAIFVDGQPVELALEIQRMITQVGMEIRSQVNRIWRSSEQGKVAAEAAHLLYVGGGAYYFAPLLRESIPALVVPKHPEVANAEGYLALGLQLPERVWARLQV